MKECYNLGEKLISLIEKKYSYLSFKSNEFQAIKKGIMSEISHTDYSNAHEVLIKYLRLFQDAHISIITPDNHQHQSFLLNNINFDNSIADSYMDNITKISKSKYSPITIGNLDDIIYIRLESLNNRFKSCFDELDSLLKKDEFANKEKFMIDLRANSGGDSALTENLASFLLGNSEPKTAYYIQKRINESNPYILSDLKEFKIKNEYNHKSKKVAVLIGPKTYSSGESTAMNLISIPQAKSIGDVSGGGSGCPVEYDLDKNFKVNLPSWICRRADKELLQNNGIIPDILINFNQTIDGKRDLVIESAIEFLNKQK